jgi:hypothetical protein
MYMLNLEYFACLDGDSLSHPALSEKEQQQGVLMENPIVVCGAVEIFD